MNKTLLSVIILNFNTRNYLEQCLQSVAESKGFGQEGLEVIVVDNGSSDGSVNVVVKIKNQKSKIKNSISIRLIKNKENLGFAGGNNVGIRQAKGKYLLLLNSDTTVYSDTLINMVRFAEGRTELGAATCRIELPGGKIDPACHRGFPTPWNAFSYLSGLEAFLPKTELFGGYHQGWKDLSTSHEVDVISGSFFMTPRAVIEKVDLLDESFFMYGEDIDWCFRIKQAGFDIWYNPEAKIVHYKKQSGRAKNREQITDNSEQRTKRMANYHFVHTMEQFYRKYYMKKYPMLVSRVILLAINIWKKVL